MTISEKTALLKRGFESGKTLPINARINALVRLRDIVMRREGEILKALHKDLNKAPQEAYMTELGLVYEELKCAIRNVRRWAKPRRVRTPLSSFPSSAKIYRQPHGVALIMSPWNYPFLLTLDPLIGAIAGGNCALVKPSAYAPATADIIVSLFTEAFDADVVSVVTGGRGENQQLMSEKFDYVFFTGSVSVGREVMKACAEHLTPLTLELGGKSPVIVAADADIPLAARRIAWAKLINAGQTCVAPDYVLAHSSIKDRLVESLKLEMIRLYGKEPMNDPDYPHIISQKHFRRALQLLPEGAVFDEGTLCIAPTVIPNADWDTPAMREEIFAPILPVLTYDDVNAMLDSINKRPKPLALYLFTNDRGLIDRVMSEVRFGGGCVNDCLMHLTSKYMPFGGAGESGMGNYHGKWSFDAFTREKSVLTRGKLDIPVRYAPYTDKKLRLVRRMLK